VDSFLCTQSLYIGVWWYVFSYWKKYHIQQNIWINGWIFAYWNKNLKVAF
jgi:hypothetical protein